jgi:hypothetical protein
VTEVLTVARWDCRTNSIEIADSVEVKSVDVNEEWRELFMYLLAHKRKAKDRGARSN